MRPDVFDEIQLLAGVRGKPEDVYPLAKAMDLFLRPLRGVTGAVIQDENDLLARAARPIREKIQQADGLFGDGVLPQAVREQERSVRVAEGSADSNAVVLSGRFDPQRLSS